MTPLPTVLVTGFGPFPGFPVNPTEALARAVDGLTVAGHTLIGRVLPVSFSRGPAEALAWVEAFAPRLVVGLGVSGRAVGPVVETRAARACRGVDVDGDTPEAPGAGPEAVFATLDVARLANVLGAPLSEDAGTYVCNAWLYRVAGEAPCPAGFIHVPPHGMSADSLIAGIEALIEGLVAPTPST